MIIILILALVFIPVIVFAMSYNGLVTKRNRTEEAWSAIDVVLKKRWDLLPNLVEVAKKYMEHERETLESVTAHRASAMGAGGSGPGRIAAENLLSRSTRGFMLAVENYPDLKADKHFTQLMSEWRAVEDELGYTRNAYNSSVNDLNNGVEKFPSNVVAGLFDFKRKEYFEIPDAHKEAPSAKELFKD